jgi:serum/glucocorticoid-regulated kinase 2
VGFETVNEDSTLDYQLSLKSLPIPNKKIYVKPIFEVSLKGKVRLDHFKLVRCLGSGGFSLVYLVRDSWAGQFYALKLINKQFILDSERETIVENERYVLGELRSPFVTELKFCFETKNHFAFMVECTLLFS